MFSMSFGFDVGKTVDRLVLARTPWSRSTGRSRRDRRRRLVRDDDAVHDVERIALSENRRGAADLNLHAAAGTPEFSKIEAPTTLPARLPSSDFAGAVISSSAETDAIAVEAFALVDRRGLTRDGHALEL